MLRAMLMSLLLATGVHAQSSGLHDANLDQACGPPCCGHDCSDRCSNKPFRPTDCKTTRHGPARANIVIGEALNSTSMLYCPGGTKRRPRPYALCFFSGPPTATGVAADNNVLTCTPDPDKGIADCACQVYNTGAFYVDINSILNRGAFYETRRACGHDGSRCKNIASCDRHGASKACSKPPCTACPDRIAPVCAYVADQSRDPDGGLYPPSPHGAGAEAELVSAFSFAMGGASGTGPYRLGSTPCSDGVYAGCMTAPCRFGDQGSADGSVVHCACPLWRGDYQIGQSGLASDLQCPQDAGWVWSAANAIVPAPPSVPPEQPR
jgi:hypothetical protein